MNGKTILIAKLPHTGQPKFNEFSVNVASMLKSMENLTNSLVDTIVQAAEALLNCKDTIQTMPSLTVALRKKFLVGAQNCKKGMYECAVYSDHVTCACSCNKFKKLCKHSLSTAEKTGMIKEHLDFLRRTSRLKAPSFFLPSAVLCRDGIHLNKAGNYALYRSYRGAILFALKKLATFSEAQ